MLNVHALQDVEHFLGDVGGVIGDALEVLVDDDQVARPLDAEGILDHLAQQFSEDLVMEIVHGVV